MIVRVLGSAAGGGFPQWNCACSNCVAARRGVLAHRTQSSIAVSPDGQRWILVNVSVDLPTQLAQTQALWPSRLRANPFLAVLLTDANVDHTAGLGELRQNPDSLTIVSSSVTKALLENERAFARFASAPHRWLGVERDASDVAGAIDDALAQSLDIEMFDVPGLLPGYAGRAPARGAVVAYVIRDRASGAAVTIAPVFSLMNDRLYDRVAASDIALLDGTFFYDDELQRQGLPAKTARHLGHAPVGGPDGTLARIASLRNRRVFVHLNNTNPLLDPNSAERRDVEATGCEVAEDGWQCDLAFAGERERGGQREEHREHAET